MAKILVIDDEMGIRELLSEILDDEGHEVVLAENAATARPLYATAAIDLVLLDIWMPDTDGMSLLREWSSQAALVCPVIMMSGHASIDTAVEAQEMGAVGFLEKPITMNKLLTAVHKALYRTSSALPTANNLPAVPTYPVVTQPLAIALPHSLAVNPLMVSNRAVSVPQASLAPWQNRLSKINLDTGLREFREEVERIYFTYLIEREQWAMTRIAEQAGLERTHLYRKLKQLNIDINRKAKT